VFLSPDKKRVTISLSYTQYDIPENEYSVSLEFIGCSLDPKRFK